ncbi:hypothetical protein MT418_007686 [Batrachochytrium dendrobatidis]
MHSSKPLDRPLLHPQQSYSSANHNSVLNRRRSGSKGSTTSNGSVSSFQHQQNDDPNSPLSGSISTSMNTALAGPKHSFIDASSKDNTAGNSAASLAGSVTTTTGTTSRFANAPPPRMLSRRPPPSTGSFARPPTSTSGPAAQRHSSMASNTKRNPINATGVGRVVSGSTQFSTETGSLGSVDGAKKTVTTSNITSNHASFFDSFGLGSTTTVHNTKTSQDHTVPTNGSHSPTRVTNVKPPTGPLQKNMNAQKLIDEFGFDQISSSQPVDHNASLTRTAGVQYHQESSKHNHQQPKVISPKPPSPLPNQTFQSGIPLLNASVTVAGPPLKSPAYTKDEHHHQLQQSQPKVNESTVSASFEPPPLHNMSTTVTKEIKPKTTYSSSPPIETAVFNVVSESSGPAIVPLEHEVSDVQQLENASFFDEHHRNLDLQDENPFNAAMQSNSVVHGVSSQSIQTNSKHSNQLALSPNRSSPVDMAANPNGKNLGSKKGVVMQNDTEINHHTFDDIDTRDRPAGFYDFALGGTLFTNSTHHAPNDSLQFNPNHNDVGAFRATHSSDVQNLNDLDDLVLGSAPLADFNKQQSSHTAGIPYSDSNAAYPMSVTPQSLANHFIPSDISTSNAEFSHQVQQQPAFESNTIDQYGSSMQPHNQQNQNQDFQRLYNNAHADDGSMEGIASNDDTMIDSQQHFATDFDSNTHNGVGYEDYATVHGSTTLFQQSVEQHQTMQPDSFDTHSQSLTERNDLHSFGQLDSADIQQHENILPMPIVHSVSNYEGTAHTTENDGYMSAPIVEPPITIAWADESQRESLSTSVEHNSLADLADSASNPFGFGDQYNGIDPFGFVQGNVQPIDNVVYDQTVDNTMYGQTVDNTMYDQTVDNTMYGQTVDNAMYAQIHDPNQQQFYGQDQPNNFDQQQQNFDQRLGYGEPQQFPNHSQGLDHQQFYDQQQSFVPNLQHQDLYQQQTLDSQQQSFDQQLVYDQENHQQQNMPDQQNQVEYNQSTNTQGQNENAYGWDGAFMQHQNVQQPVDKKIQDPYSFSTHDHLVRQPSPSHVEQYHHDFPSEPYNPSAHMPLSEASAVQSKSSRLSPAPPLSTTSVTSGYSKSNNHMAQNALSTSPVLTNTFEHTPVSTTRQCPSCLCECKATAKFCGECGLSLKQIAHATEHEKSVVEYAPNPVQTGYATDHTYQQSDYPQVNNETGVSYQFVPDVGVSGSSNMPHFDEHQQQQNYAEPAQLYHGQQSQYSYNGYDQQEHSNYDYSNNTYTDPHAQHAQAISQSPVQAQQPQKPLEFSDPLGRHRGHVFASFGFGGKLVVMRPRRQVLYLTSNTGLPTVTEKSYPGPILTINVKSILYSAITKEIEVAFEGKGPLVCSRNIWNKKKLISHLDNCFLNSENTVAYQSQKTLLWKMARLALEQDGVMLGSGNQATELSTAQQIRTILDTKSTKPNSGQHNDPHFEMHAMLLEGDRKGACQIATANLMWPHALIISSHVDRQTYADVTMQFSRSGLQTPATKPPHGAPLPGINVIYGLFAGAGPNAIYEFLPGPFGPENMPPEEYIDRWRFILSVILANRTPGDTDAILALGDQLATYGLVNEAHTCFLAVGAGRMLTGSDTLNSGNSKIIMLGANHVSQPTTFFKDIDAFHITETLEFALTLGSGGISNGFPHFQAYKFWYATYLSDLGFQNLAFKYTEGIEHFIKTFKNGSPYFHQTFCNKLCQFTDQLLTSMSSFESKAAAKDADDASSGGWLRKISSNLTGAALGRGLEQFMNNAVGVEDDITQPVKPQGPMYPTTSHTDGLLSTQSSSIPSQPSLAGNMSEVTTTLSTTTEFFSMMPQIPIVKLRHTQSNPTHLSTSMTSTSSIGVPSTSNVVMPFVSSAANDIYQHHPSNVSSTGEHAPLGSVSYPTYGMTQPDLHQTSQLPPMNAGHGPYASSFSHTSPALSYHADPTETRQELQQPSYMEQNQYEMQTGEFTGNYDYAANYDTSAGYPQTTSYDQSTEYAANAVHEQGANYEQNASAGYGGAEVYEQNANYGSYADTGDQTTNTMHAQDQQHSQNNGYYNSYHDQDTQQQFQNETHWSSYQDNQNGLQQHQADTQWNNYTEDPQTFQPSQNDSQSISAANNQESRDDKPPNDTHWSSYQKNDYSSNGIHEDTNHNQPPLTGPFFGASQELPGQTLQNVSKKAVDNSSFVPSFPLTFPPPANSTAGALPAFSPVVPPEPDAVDDFGFDNKSIRKAKSAFVLRPSSPLKAGENAPSEPVRRNSGSEQPTEKDKTSPTPAGTPDPAGGARNSRTILSYFGSMFGRPSKPDDKDSATQAFLPSGNALVFDKDLKKWVTKGGEPVGGPEKQLAPPPIKHMAETGAPTEMKPAMGAPTLGSAETPPGPMGPTLNSKPSTGSLGASRRSARSRYVDVINPNAAKESVPAINLALPTRFGMPSEQSQPKIMMPPFQQQANGSTSSFYDDFVKSNDSAAMETQPTSNDQSVTRDNQQDLPVLDGQHLASTEKQHQPPFMARMADVPARISSVPPLDTSHPQPPSARSSSSLSNHPQNIASANRSFHSLSSQPLSTVYMSNSGVQQPHHPSTFSEVNSSGEFQTQPGMTRLTPRLANRVVSNSRQGTPPSDL